MIHLLHDSPFNELLIYQHKIYSKGILCLDTFMAGIDHLFPSLYINFIDTLSPSPEDMKDMPIEK